MVAVRLTTAVTAVTAAVMVGASMVSKFSLGASFFMLANSLQIARSLCIMQTMLPANIYLYFNNDMKIFNFEIPGVPSLTSTWFSSMSVNLRLYESEEKFSNYGIDSFAFVKQFTQSLLSATPLAVFYLAQLIIGKTLGLVIPLGVKIAGAASATLAFNYPLRFGLERFYDFSINAFLDLRNLDTRRESRELVRVSSLMWVSFSMAITFILLTVVLFGVMLFYLLRKRQASWS